MSELAVRECRPEDEPAVIELLARAFGPRSVEMFDWRYHQVPFPTLKLVLSDDDGTVVGFVGGVAVAGWIDGRPSRFALHGDLVVARPGEGGGRRLLDATRTRPLGMVRYSFPAEHTSGMVVESGRTPRAGRLPQWVRWATPRALAASSDRPLPGPARGVAGLVLHASRVVAGRPRRLTIEPLESLGADIDTLATDSAAFAHCILRRDAAYFRWRWLERPDRRWRLAAARDSDGRLRGVVVHGSAPSRLHDGTPVGRIVDLLARDAAAARVLIDHAARSLEREGCVMTLCELNDPRRWSKWAMRRAGFVLRGKGPLFHATGAPGYESARAQSNWYLTMGDTDLV